MSYSRWSYSLWYTFWASNDGFLNQVLKNRQRFEVCSVASFSYAEIKDSLIKCLIKCEEVSEKQFTPSRKITSVEERELQGYMLEFLYDMDKIFSLKRMPGIVWKELRRLIIKREFKNKYKGEKQ